MHEDEESFIEDVAHLWKLLRVTELNLQTVGQKLSQSEGHYDQEKRGQQSPECLTSVDPQSPDVPPPQSACVCQVRPLSLTPERHDAAGSLSPLSSDSRSASFKDRLVKMEPVSSRKKFGCVRQENACLSIHDEQLFSDLDALQYHSTSFKSRVKGPRIKNNVAEMSEQIQQLQAELDTQTRELQAAELKAECSQEAAAHSDIVVATLTDELSALREELDNRTALGKRAEQQRNQALQNAEKLKDAFNEYKATISIKLEMVMGNESKLKESLVECDRERQEWERKCSMLEREKVEQSQTISQLKEEERQAKSGAAGLQAQLEEAGRKTLQLERKLMEWGVESRELASLRKELEELRSLTQSQDQRVAQSHREAQQNKGELASLEAILALLHLREGSVGTLCARPCMLPPVDFSGTAQLLKLQPGEGYQQLLRVLQSVEAERSKQNGLIDRLQDRLSRAQEEISSLQTSMAQRASHYQNLHTELMDKVSQATDTGKELKRKSARAASLEKQLQEKTSAYSQAALTNTELEKQLLEKTNALQHFQSLMTKKQREYQQSLETCKNSQTQQFTEQQHRIEMLQLSVEKAQSQVLEMEQELRSLQRERDKAQEAALLLQRTVDQLTQQRQVEVRNSEELLQSFKDQATQSATKVLELQSSLSACRGELNVYLQQMEEVKKSYESEQQRNNDKVSSLQGKLHGASLACQSSSEQIVQLQLSLQQQQSMLSESTAHIAELEESQSLLQTQVSSLEQQLERARASLQDEVSNRQQVAHEKDQDLQETKLQNTQLSESVSHMTSEMTKCRGELVSKDMELQRLRKDVIAKSSHINRVEDSLQHVTNQLNRKSDIVADLEEKLHLCEADKLNCVQRVQVLEGQLQVVRGELADTLEQLQKLKDVLQKTQTTADEWQASVEKMSVQLSETQRELEERTHEVLDMDNALKERQGELQQRAQLLAQLDVAIREHKQEMEMKVESLQQRLEDKDKELRDAQKKLTDRDMKESKEFGHQLRVCQQELQTLLQDLEQTRSHCDALTTELDAAKEKEVRLLGLEEELGLKEAHWLQSEAGLQSTISSLEQELELQREEHTKELESLQQTRGQLLKVSEQISSTMRSSQEQLTTKLQQSQDQLELAKAQCDQTKIELERTRSQVVHLQTERDQTQAQLLQSKGQLEQTRAHSSHLHAQLQQLSTQLHQARVQVAQLQGQLQVSEKSMETSSESLLIKESEVTRLQARISCLERAADRQHLFGPTLSLPALHSPERSSSSAHPPLSSPQKQQTSFPSSDHKKCSPHLLSPKTLRRTCSSPPDHTYLQSPSDPHVANQTHDWLQRSIIDSTLGLPPNLKATLKEALNKQQSNSSSSTTPSISFLQQMGEDHGWQGLSTMDATATSDLSFNPLTYMVDRQDDSSLITEDVSVHRGDEYRESESRRESVSTLVGSEEEADRSSLTGMLRFVNQTLAMQEDRSLWSSTGPTQTGPQQPHTPGC